MTASAWLDDNRPAAEALDTLRRLGAKVDVVLPDGTHLYWCTGHRHGVEEHCASSVRLDGGPKLPARCKWCPAACAGSAKETATA